jgi:hypothetical protein
VDKEEKEKKISINIYISVTLPSSLACGAVQFTWKRAKLPAFTVR